MKKIITISILLIIIIGLISFGAATLVGYLSNTVTASVTVVPHEPDEIKMPLFLSDCVPPVEHNNWGWRKYLDEDNEPIFNGANECVQHVIHEVCKSDDNPFSNPGLCIAASAPGNKNKLKNAIDECLDESEEDFFICVANQLKPNNKPTISGMTFTIFENFNEDEEYDEEKDNDGLGDDDE
jgi:hypothetical protein